MPTACISVIRISDALQRFVVDSESSNPDAAFHFIILLFFVLSTASEQEFLPSIGKTFASEFSNQQQNQYTQ
jgi:hypothetical protein